MGCPHCERPRPRVDVLNLDTHLVVSTSGAGLFAVCLHGLEFGAWEEPHGALESVGAVVAAPDRPVVGWADDRELGEAVVGGGSGERLGYGVRLGWREKWARVERWLGEHGGDLRVASARFGISVRTLQRWRRRAVCGM